MSLALLLALLLDALLGEPRWLWSRLPHPAVLMGRAVALLDRRLNRGRRWQGIVAVTLLVAGAAVLGLALAALPGRVAEVVVGAVLLAQRSLAEHVAAVGAALRRGLAEGRRSVALIVGRDTAGMGEADVARGAIESAAENLSDGVIAPALWFLVAGLPGILVYKAVNTADSMIGYRTPRHAAFGWAAARLDDLLNLVPARLTFALLWLAAGAPGGWRGAAQDARRHRSPNAGWPEAAMARALGVALSGPRSYGGTRTETPFVNAAGRRHPGPPEIDTAVRLLWRAWGWLLAGVGITLLLF
ncbi:cobalamin biosynthesis protein CobD [Oceanicola granulosus HTCC2516]|uniref:Cobalamin biosynthesis protein CobD n=1 Tax=Oceanicola granulosus (strain ATCC BAA-861 / DSM 15982 / KCTC 12143 / HTCC2516) TaxID=314256 RepID=Q2CK41_OCEGH|nr:adenosylcobinamide-phosphate synthase CbiB [Oceanicola granulosus]EAR52948.1 cobalamin biosynthesis protein CobD [Oceanicola granulosus HTCC2516]